MNILNRRHNEELYERNSDLGIQLENALEENANLRGNHSIHIHISSQ